ncbi:nitroreductase [Actinomyces sp. B33]|uniref:nitroreductase n=1 Tax=Actinomyces sp. B33 TaxID=2942131 RepID=UPI00233F8FAF|nr:nitroreductase [Actinomyces sp. B33]MDC4233753.1 nitroreductase [Actinomyces sp. B33]
MTATPFTELAASRHSVRSFRPDPVPADVLDAIVDDARHAPSWSNTRPYQVALATGARADRLRAAYVERFDQTLDVQHKKRGSMARMVLTGKIPDGDYPVWRRYPADLRPRSVEVGTGLYAHMGIAREDRAARDEAARANCRAFNAPVMGFVFVHKGLMPFAALDAGLMLQTLFLAAASRGVDSCALGTLATWRGPVDAEFDVPDDYRLITGFALGYADDAPVNGFRAPRRPLVLVPAKRPDEQEG